MLTFPRLPASYLITASLGGYLKTAFPTHVDKSVRMKAETHLFTPTVGANTFGFEHT